MDILKIATEWAKAELVSTSFFIAIGIMFLFISFGFWNFGKTELARSYVVPILAAGAFLTTVGIGLFFTNKSRITQFKIAHEKNVLEFIDSEIDRTNATLKEYKNVVFTAIPIIIATCAIILFLFSGPLWRASMISTIAMLSVILLIDGLAHARIAEYHQELLQSKERIMENAKF